MVAQVVTRNDRERRVLGALFGLACGDALGATLEFRSRALIVAEYGPLGPGDLLGGGWLGLPPGGTTDDTAMALCVLDGIAEAGADAPVDEIVEAVGRHFVRWMSGNPPDIGATVRAALELYVAFGSWPTVRARMTERFGDRAAGNGGLMRALPVSFFWPGHPARTAEVSRALTAITHPAPAALWCSVFYNLLVAEVLDGRTVTTAARVAWHMVPQVAPDLAGAAPGHHVLARVLDDPGAVAADQVADMGGYCLDTLAGALWSCCTAQTAEEAIRRAASLGGDTDTVAAVAGGIAGAVWGYDGLPRRWTERLLDRNALLASFLRWRGAAGAPGPRTGGLT